MLTRRRPLAIGLLAISFFIVNNWLLLLFCGYLEQ